MGISCLRAFQHQHHVELDDLVGATVVHLTQSNKKHQIRCLDILHLFVNDDIHLIIVAPVALFGCKSQIHGLEVMVNYLCKAIYGELQYYLWFS